MEQKKLRQLTQRDKLRQLTQRDFEKELKTMAVSCIGVKENTAKKKASNILKKYIELISWSKYDREFYKEKYNKSCKMFEVLKSGKIEYSQGNKTEGVILIKNIEQVEVREANILIIMKSGREIIMSSEFNFLGELL